MNPTMRAMDNRRLKLFVPLFHSSKTVLRWNKHFMGQLCDQMAIRALAIFLVTYGTFAHPMRRVGGLRYTAHQKRCRQSRQQRLIKRRLESAAGARALMMPDMRILRRARVEPTSQALLTIQRASRIDVRHDGLFGPFHRAGRTNYGVSECRYH
jgi:hypothetical protein